MDVEVEPPNRRERLRRELTDQIVAIGRRQLADGGPAAVSWRGIAKEVGMNPASLYTYVDGIDDLFTRILLDSFHDLAAHVAAAAAAPVEPVAGAGAGLAADPGARLIAACLAYRAWAVAHPQQFNLIYTDQIPGYAAPPDGPTVAAELAVAAPLLALFGEIIGRPLDPVTLVELPLEERTRVFAPFAALHGFVLLEINNHAPMLDTEAMLRLHLESVLATLTPPAPTRRRSTRPPVSTGDDPVG